MQRAFRKKTGIENMADYADKAVFYNNETGISVKWAGIHMAAIAISLEIVLFDIFQFLSKKDFYNYICAKNGQINQLLFIAILVGVTLFINYATIFKDKKYLIYFEEFERLPQKKQTLYCRVCAVGYLLLIALAIYSVTWTYIA